MSDHTYLHSVHCLKRQLYGDGVCECGTHERIRKAAADIACKALNAELIPTGLHDVHDSYLKKAEKIVRKALEASDE